MGETAVTETKCANCGEPQGKGAEACPACGTILARPGTRKPAPAWFIGLLIAVILALAAYASVTAYQVLVLHSY